MGLNCTSVRDDTPFHDRFVSKNGSSYSVDFNKFLSLTDRRTRRAYSEKRRPCFFEVAISTTVPQSVPILCTVIVEQANRTGSSESGKSSVPNSTRHTHVLQKSIVHVTNVQRTHTH